MGTPATLTLEQQAFRDVCSHKSLPAPWKRKIKPDPRNRWLLKPTPIGECTFNLWTRSSEYADYPEIQWDMEHLYKTTKARVKRDEAEGKYSRAQTAKLQMLRQHVHASRLQAKGRLAKLARISRHRELPDSQATRTRPMRTAVLEQQKIREKKKKQESRRKQKRTARSLARARQRMLDSSSSDSDSSSSSSSESEDDAESSSEC